MSCCGSKRQQAVNNAHVTSGAVAAPAQDSYRRPVPDGEIFIYDGAARLMITGKVSGRRYQFARRGDRVLIDARDVDALAATPKLRRISSRVR